MEKKGTLINQYQLEESGIRKNRVNSSKVGEVERLVSGLWA